MSRSARPTLTTITETIGAVVFVVMLRRLAFEVGATLDVLAIAVGLIGLLSAWLARRSIRTLIDAPLAVYVGLTLVSALLNRHRFAPLIIDMAPRPQWQPALHVAALAIYLYGVSGLLATSQRVSLLVTAIVVAISLFGVQGAYDHALQGFDYRLMYYPSVGQWNGYAEISLLFLVAFTLPLGLVVVTQSAPAIAAASIVALVLFLDVCGTYSRSAFICGGATFAAVTVLEVWKLRGRRLLMVWTAVLVMACALLALQIRPGRSPLREFVDRVNSFDNSRAYAMRVEIWRRAGVLIRQHFWLGVGPGAYSDAMLKTFSRTDAPEGAAVHAHNTILHVAAESGVPACLAFLLVWWRLLAGLMARCTRSHVGVLAFAMVGALTAFGLRSLSDYFLGGFATADQMSFVLWTLFGLAVAVTRLPRAEPLLTE